MEMVEVDEVEDVMTTEKMAEIAIKVLCAGMSAALSSHIFFHLFCYSIAESSYFVQIL
jgi:hypothetical protein